MKSGFLKVFKVKVLYQLSSHAEVKLPQQECAEPQVREVLKAECNDNVQRITGHPKAGLKCTDRSP